MKNKEKEVSTQEMYAVVEVCNREIQGVSLKYDLKSAIKEANILLKTYMASGGYEKTFDSGAEEGDKWEKASIESHNSWCNLGDNQWDTFISTIN